MTAFRVSSISFEPLVGFTKNYVHHLIISLELKCVVTILIERAEKGHKPEFVVTYFK